LLFYIRKYGYFSAFLGFIPVLGPLLTVAMGGFQIKFQKVITIIFVVNLLWRAFLII